MAIRKHAFTLGEYYHVYNRGNSRQNIFLDTHDHGRFQRMLYLTNGCKHVRIDLIRDSGVDFYKFKQDQHLVAIGAYCLMPNHFHILLTPLVEGGVSLFMQKLSTGYSMYFNQRHGRTGSLFEGKFKSQHANEDIYLKYLFPYIHMNPLKLIDPQWKDKGVMNKRRAQQYLERYPFSSLMDYLGWKRDENRILHTNSFPQYFDDPESVRKNMYTWFSERQDLSE